MSIKKATLADLEEVTQLVSEVSQTDVLPLLSAEGRQQFQNSVLPDVAKTFNGKEFSTFVAIHGEKIVGFAALRGGDYLTHLFVSKGSQGTGLGRELLEHIVSFSGANSISLRSSINAVGFYRYCGFVATGDEAEFRGIRFVPMTLTRSTKGDK
jgi:GNAT superfamily N-acetyltransferase